MDELTSREKALQSLLSTVRKGLIAYSGGVDSAYLLWFAHRHFPGQFLGVLADSPSLKREELQNALAFAKQHGLPVRVIHTRETDNPDYISNPANRCYFCKFELFEQMNSLARDENFDAICYGENSDDGSDFRPGKKAATEFSVLAPLSQAGLTKADIRELAQRAGLSVAEKPAQPCLASRIPQGNAVTPEKLRDVERAEAVLEQAGFKIVRVRHLGSRALLQVGPDEVARLHQLDADKSISRKIREIGFEEVALDPAGYAGASLR